MLCLTRHPLFDTVTGASCRLIKSNFARAATLWCGNVNGEIAALGRHKFLQYFTERNLLSNQCCEVNEGFVIC